MKFIGGLLLVGFLVACSQPPKQERKQGGLAETRANAELFVNQASSELEEVSQRAGLAAFENETDATTEHQTQKELAELELNRVVRRIVADAAAYDGLDLPASIARQIRLLRVPPAMPSPTDEKLAQDLVSIRGVLSSNYKTAQYCARPPRCRTKDQLYEIVKGSRDPNELLSAWTEWHDVAVSIRTPYRRSVELLNRGARDRGMADASIALLSQYEMPAEEFAREYDRLWEQVKPLYKDLHCHARAKLRERYGDLVPERGLIPAHLLGNMWAQYWHGIDDLLEIPSAASPINVTEALKAQQVEPLQMVRLAENFFRSMGFPELPPTFWTKSVFVKTPEKRVNCHASAWAIDPKHSDVRLKMCVNVTEDDFRILHHELGHIYNYLAYSGQPFLFQDSANPGFHEALGDTISLAITPEYLQQIGLASAVSDENDLSYLMRVALEKIPALAMAAVVDTWRWKVYSGEITPDRYNQGWWEQVSKYQGLAPPVPRSEADFDAGMFYHISYGVPYDRYFTAGLLQFDFYRALCKASGHRGPLHRCSFYGSKAAGEQLLTSMKRGKSAPWPEVLHDLTGSRTIDGAAIVEYLAPVHAWLKERNKGRQCGWE